MNSQYHIDTPKHADYPLPAGRHCQSVLAGRIYPTHTKKSLFFVGIPTCPSLRRNGRGTSSDVLIFG